MRITDAGSELTTLLVKLTKPVALAQDQKVQKSRAKSSENNVPGER